MAEEQNRTLSDKFMLRLPDGMRDRIRAAAEANNRSMNAEIVATLEKAYPPPMLHMRDISMFLQMMATGIDGQDDEEHAELVRQVNAALAEQEHPFTIVVGDAGSLMLYPYPTRSDDKRRP